MPDAFDRIEGRDSEKGDAFDRFSPEEEPSYKSFARNLTQIPQGVLEATTPGLLASLWQILGQGEALDPEEIDRIRAISEREGIPFDEEKYLEAVQNASESIPTVSNIARKAEELTGAPLEPKTRTQKGVRFLSSATKLAPQNATLRPLNVSLPKPVLGASITAAKEGLQELGVPEPLAELGSFAILKKPTEGAPKLSIGTKKKPSGLTERRFEKLQESTDVSPSTINKINSKTEKEFRDITADIIKDSPISEIHENLSKDVGFKSAARENFKKVEDLAETLPKTFDTDKIKTDLESLVSNKKNVGLTPSEFDKSHNKFIKAFIKETPAKKFTAKELVAQYRKNNKQLAEAYEPGQSFAYNRAKREALLDYNKLIADTIEKEFPNSEFSNLFKETNKVWTDISDSEAISKFLDKLFKEKINFKKARELFDKEGMTLPFKRALGNEGLAKFQTLLNDLLSTEKGLSLLKAAEKMGFIDLAKTVGAYIIHPKIGGLKLGYDSLKGGYQKIFEMLLDKPQLAVTWNRGINAMKKGDFKVAEKEFSKVKAAETDFEKSMKAKKETLKKVNERNKNKIDSDFKTKKGSLYKINEDGSTTRDKSYRPEHGFKEKGLQKKSDKTWFVSKEDLNKLSEFQTQGVSKRIVELPDGFIGIMYESGKDAGKVEARTIIKPNNKPDLNLYPVEIWDKGRKVHFGNQIIELKQKNSN